MPSSDPLVEVSARLTVLTPPSVAELYFWALQVTFEDGSGAHVGLQHLQDRRHAANWGGYVGGGGGRELQGAPAGNTHPFEWSAGESYVLRVRRVAEGWEGSVAGGLGAGSDSGSGSAAFSRVLFAGGSTLSSPMVWSEVFAGCDDPSVRVRWDQLRAVTSSGAVVAPVAVRTSYQSPGCGNTDVVVDGDGFVQVTSVPRVTGPGASLVVQP